MAEKKGEWVTIIGGEKHCRWNSADTMFLCGVRFSPLLLTDHTSKTVRCSQCQRLLKQTIEQSQLVRQYEAENKRPPSARRFLQGGGIETNRRKH